MCGSVRRVAQADGADVFFVAEDPGTGDTLRGALEQRGHAGFLGLEALDASPSVIVLVGSPRYCRASRRAVLGLGHHHYIAVVPFERYEDLPQLLREGFHDAVCGEARVEELSARLQLGQQRLSLAEQAAELRALGGSPPSGSPLRSDRAQANLERDHFTVVGTLAAGVAHEINNPLTYIRGNLEFALQSLQPGEQTVVEADLVEALREAREGTVRVADIVTNLKTFSRMDDDDEGPCALPRVLAIALRLTRNEIRHCAELRVRDLDDLPRVRGSSSRLAQVFVNLLLNAAQAIESRGGDRGVISLQGYTRDGYAVVEIRDDGVGIPADLQRRIFDPFYSTRPLGLGTGLGLPVALNLVRNAGGYLELESELDKGSLLRVALPVVGPSMPITLSSAPERLAAEPKRVLVVDDEGAVLSTLRRMLTGDAHVRLADSVADALTALAEEEFDAIVCDLMMPGPGGREVYRAAVAHDGEYEQRFIFITGGAFREDDVEFLYTQHERTLEKPLNRRRLLAMLRQIPRRGA